MSQYRWMRELVGVWALGAFAATGCFVVDDTDSDDDEDAGAAGEENGGTGGSRGGASSGGSSKGGSAPTGGTDVGGTDAGGTAGTEAGGTGGSSTGGAEPTGGTAGTGGGTGAVLKFCNLLFITDQTTMVQTPVELTLDFAGTTTSAMSDTCTPIVPEACTPIPSVTDPIATLLDGTTPIISLQFTLVVTSSSEVIMIADTDAAGAVTITGGTFLPEFPCADTDPLAQKLGTRSNQLGGFSFADTFRVGKGREALRGSVGSRLYLPGK